MMEEQVWIHNALLSILDRADEKAVAKDCTSGTFEPPKEWEDTGTSEAGSDMREEFVDTYDRLLRCNEQGIINIHQIRSFDFLLGVLLGRLKKSLEAHLDASETPGELAKALYTMRELKLMRGLLDGRGRNLNCYVRKTTISMERFPLPHAASLLQERTLSL